MGRWLKQTDTLIMMTLLLGLFLFRFGDAAWAALSPQLVWVQSTLSDQLDRMTISLVSQPEAIQAADSPVDQPHVTSPVGATSPVSSPAHCPHKRITIRPSCGFGHGYGWQN